MTAIFIIAALMSAIVVLVILHPLMQTGPTTRTDDANKDIALYRRQLMELDAELKNGDIEHSAYQSARAEIARRMLAADQRRSTIKNKNNKQPPKTAQLPETKHGQGTTQQIQQQIAWAIMILLPVSAMALYMYLGSPMQPDMPLSARGLVPQEQLRDVMLGQKKLMDKVLNQPDSPEALMITGISAQERGDYQGAVEAFAKALEHTPNALMLRGMLGHAMVQAAGGLVTDDAMKQFDMVLKKQPDNALGLYYSALYHAQKGNVEDALSMWQDILANSPQDAPWLPIVKSAIKEWTQTQTKPTENHTTE